MATVGSSVRKALAGVVVDTTSVSTVNPETNSLPISTSRPAPPTT